MIELLYILHDTRFTPNVVKIGRTVDFRMRIRQHSSSNPAWTILNVMAFEHGANNEERWLKKLYADRQYMGSPEIFCVSDEERVFLELLTAAFFGWGRDFNESIESYRAISPITRLADFFEQTYGRSRASIALRAI